MRGLRGGPYLTLLFTCAHTHSSSLTPQNESSFYQLLPVAIHEIGHALGLKHSSTPEDVMSPFYIAGQTKLSANDARVVKEMYV